MITRESLEGIASKYGVGFRDHTDKVEFYILFNPDFEWHEQSLVLWWEENPNGIEYNKNKTRRYFDHHTWEF